MSQTDLAIPSVRLRGNASGRHEKRCPEYHGLCTR
ncbi:Uncharacterised protein [Vibrio cholerae]|nr:Uncharacterised protein [Vibrio cholerae]